MSFGQKLIGNIYDNRHGRGEGPSACTATGPGSAGSSHAGTGHWIQEEDLSSYLGVLVAAKPGGIESGQPGN